MSDEDAPHQMRWPRVAGYAILAVGLYVLSNGPAIYLFPQRSPTAERLSFQFNDLSALRCEPQR
jgi:hypothetical protein